MLTTVIAFGLLSSQADNDPYRKLMREYWAQPKASFSTVKIIDKREAAQAPKASAFTRFTFGAMVVVAIDKAAINPVPGTIDTFYARQASEVLKESELKLSPSYCYVLARLGRLKGDVRDIEVKAAKMYYDAKHDGLASFLCGEVMMFHPSALVRSQSLAYALQAQKKLPDSLANRRLVAGGYYYKAKYTNAKDMWKAAVSSYDKALELSKIKDDTDSLMFYRQLAIKKMNGEKPKDTRVGGDYKKRSG